MLPSGLFSNKTSLHTRWSLSLAPKWLEAGPEANLAAPSLSPSSPTISLHKQLLFPALCWGRRLRSPLRIRRICFAFVCCKSHPCPAGTPKENTKGTSPRPHAGRLRAGQMWSCPAPAATEPLWSHRLPKQITGSAGQGLLAPGLWAQARHHHGCAPSKLDLTRVQAADPGLAGCTQRSPCKHWGPAHTAVLTQRSAPTVLSRKGGGKSNKQLCRFL